ncbi:chemotaxis protein CheB [Microcoleus sp. FACHB-831]|uniref:chemotaxis protein CheB n=1 Tax=Microcoleus sp. FACHB-831 TaxID=2692827 RepID=UPI001686EF14|nr:chemotaxis protein CheB [Microcoleus sp. FACHB-831]MBD1921364.1 chemotaxis protein CheB [Microcoleus sp. FACHB-831]
MPRHDIIVIGASAGGVEALINLVKNLPAELPAAIFIVVHIPSHSKSVLPIILTRAGSLRACHPQEGAKIENGQIYVAPPDYHLLVKQGCVTLARSARENSHRPAVDPLFRSAARVYGRRVVGVVLSGALDDGTAGLVAVKQRGGVAIVQDPAEAMFTGMPTSAIENVDVDSILPITAIASRLISLTEEPVDGEEADPPSGDMQMEVDMAKFDIAAANKDKRPGKPSGFGCPDCGGALWELREGELIRFRCRTGHAYSADTLLAEQSEALETALWNAFRALEERATLSHRLLKRARDRQQILSAARYEDQAKDAELNAAIIRDLLMKGTIDVRQETQQGQPSNISADGHTSNGKLKDNSLTSNVQATINLVAIATSAGGLKALTELLSALPKNFPAAIAIVQHLDPNYASQLAEILSRRTSLEVKQAVEGDLLLPGTVYIAPPNNHLLVNSDKTISLSKSELVNFSRPSADLLFESVAASFKERAIAVVLTGKGKDGASGLRAIKKMGGRAIAQDRASSEEFGMPQAAIDTDLVDAILPLNEIAAVLVSMASQK